MKWLRVLAWIASLLWAACGRSDAAADGRAGELTVFAAASLRNAFTALGRDFERDHPGAVVSFNFAGSQDLRLQIEHGAPADVIATADREHMEALARASLTKAPLLFARNEPVVVVSQDAAERVRHFAELPNAERIVLGAPDVPVGRYARQILERARGSLGDDFAARVLARVVSNELNVRQVLAKVALGEAQAAIVYRSDVTPAPAGVRSVVIPVALNVDADYPMAVLRHARHPGLAAAWVSYVLSPVGQQRLASAGFMPPRIEASP